MRHRTQAELRNSDEDLQKCIETSHTTCRSYPGGVLAAAHIKAQYAVAYADAFSVSLAQELGATVVTADPEFKRVASLVDILWL
ncbi:MAG TPA: type II toxin-antitoxin system VapC family toxin [Deltaproteobacteria bacterium]|nr:type II toxin-antitoxin system VapC family toxin [Deltaproteobacteria bacterium]